MIKITMPQAGQSMEEGTILSWRKHEGEKVRKGEILLEIETDKANVEVEAPESGVLRQILCPEGTTVPVLATIALLAECAEEARSFSPETGVEPQSPEHRAVTLAQPAESSSSRPQAAAEGLSAISGEVRGTPLPRAGRVKASPLARKIAKERGLDLGSIRQGSGPGGRILSSDVERAVPAPSAAAQQDRRPMSGMRRAIARNLLLSKQTIPHFYMKLTIDAASLQSFSKAEKARYPCSVTDVITLACARVIREFPAFRSRLAGDDLVESPESNIGLAVGMEDGLRVPVLVGAERLTLSQVADQARRVTEAAHRGKVEAMGRGVFTISNLGMYGVEEFSAIINPPEAAILAVGAIRESVVVKDGAMRPGRVMTMTLSADHRIIDGLLAARFMGRLKEILESPAQLGS
jgi:pyruvate dehydrogenase E2 component (dihydrolipoamide acetyltransferase)